MAAFHVTYGETVRYVLFMNSLPHFGQRIAILPFPFGTLIFCLQVGQV
jgi:hypothetical protein